MQNLEHAHKLEVAFYFNFKFKRMSYVLSGIPSYKSCNTNNSSLELTDLANWGIWGLGWLQHSLIESKGGA